MPRLQRAAQFAPFDALTGFTETITERAHYTDQAAELDEAQREQLDQKTRFLMDRIGERPYVTLHYFEPDGRKSGGVCERCQAASIALIYQGRRFTLKTRHQSLFPRSATSSESPRAGTTP